MPATAGDTSRPTPDPEAGAARGARPGAVGGARAAHAGGIAARHGD